MKESYSVGSGVFCAVRSEEQLRLWLYLLRVILNNSPTNSQPAVTLKWKLIYDRQSASPSRCRAPVRDPRPTFSFSLKPPPDSCGPVTLQRPLWREDGSVIYCAIASGPCQSSNSWVKVPQNSRPYFAVSCETPPPCRARSPYVYPPGTGWPSYTPGHWAPP
jgi:hypothetical protein